MSKIVHLYDEKNEIYCNKTLSTAFLFTTTRINEVTCKRCIWFFSLEKSRFIIRYKKCKKCKKEKQTFTFNKDSKICITCENKEIDRIYQLNKKLHPEKNIMRKIIEF